MDKEEMLSLRLDGLTYSQISRQSGVSRQRVQQLLSPPRQIRAFVVGKFTGLCNDCGITVGKGGHVHHIGSTNEDDYNDIDNLELLCPSCHRRKHRGEPKEVMLLSVGDSLKAELMNEAKAKNLSLARYVELLLAGDLKRESLVKP